MKIMFVCLGNICRSPAAQAIFDSMLKENKLENIIETESSGTGSWHIGHKADPRMIDQGLKNGVEIKNRAKKLDTQDIYDYDLILAMDSSNYEDIIYLCNGDKDLEKKIKMFRHFDPIATPSDINVPDPYYGKDDGFKLVWEMLDRTNASLIKYIKEKIKI